jgi:hypothetical protein
VPLVAISIKLDRIEEELLYQDNGGGWWLSAVCTFEEDAKGRTIVAQSIPRERFAAGERGPQVGYWREIGGAPEAFAEREGRFRPVQIQEAASSDEAAGRGRIPAGRGIASAGARGATRQAPWIRAGPRSRENRGGERVSQRTMPAFVRELLASPPRRGNGLNNWFFRAARVLHPFLSREEITRLLQAATYGERIQPGEIKRAVERSAACAWVPGEPVQPVLRPTWPTVDAGQREAVLEAADGLGLVDLWEGSPVRFEDNLPHTEEIVDALFPGDALLCCAKSNSEFATRTREDWRGKLAAMQFIVPSPMMARTGRTQDGRESEHTLANTAERRFLVIEQDSGTVDEQAAILAHLAERAPLSLAVHSGSRSLHGWFHCQGQGEERLRAFMRYAVSLGADPATWTRSQFVRMPDGTRGKGSRQVVYFFNPGVIK